MGSTDASSSDGNTEVPPFLNVETLLGIKGGLRFVPHGSEQKPHLILRRVLPANNDDEDESSRNVARFSFFAKKRIEVKPGKEILFCVASANDEESPYEDLPVVFQGDIGVSSSLVSDNSKAAEPIQDPGPSLRRTGSALPPKIRKSLAGTSANADFLSNHLGHDAILAPFPQSNSTTRGYVTAAVQTDPPPPTPSTSVIHAVVPQERSATTQPNTPVPSLPHSPSVDRSAPVQQDMEPKTVSVSSNQPQEVIQREQVAQEPRLERSLSPMDVSSGSNSPAGSPMQVPRALSPASSIASSDAAGPAPLLKNIKVEPIQDPQIPLLPPVVSEPPPQAQPDNASASHGMSRPRATPPPVTPIMSSIVAQNTIDVDSWSDFPGLGSRTNNPPSQTLPPRPAALIPKVEDTSSSVILGTINTTNSSSGSNPADAPPVAPAPAPTTQAPKPVVPIPPPTIVPSPSLASSTSSASRPSTPLVTPSSSSTAIPRHPPSAPSSSSQYIPASTLNNPLGIRPSSSLGRTPPIPHHVPQYPRTNPHYSFHASSTSGHDATLAMPAKKVVIGSNWSASTRGIPTGPRALSFGPSRTGTPVIHGTPNGNTGLKIDAGKGKVDNTSIQSSSSTPALATGASQISKAASRSSVSSSSSPPPQSHPPTPVSAGLPTAPSSTTATATNTDNSQHGTTRSTFTAPNAKDSNARMSWGRAPGSGVASEVNANGTQNALASAINGHASASAGGTPLAPRRPSGAGATTTPTGPAAAAPQPQARKPPFTHPVPPRPPAPHQSITRNSSSSSIAQLPSRPASPYTPHPLPPTPTFSTAAGTSSGLRYGVKRERPTTPELLAAATPGGPGSAASSSATSGASSLGAGWTRVSGNSAAQDQAPGGSNGAAASAASGSTTSNGQQPQRTTAATSSGANKTATGPASTQVAPEWPATMWNDQHTLEPLPDAPKDQSTVSIRKIVFSPLGDRFALICADRTLRVWTTQTPAEMARLQHHSRIVSAAWTGDGRGIVVLNEQGLIMMWKASIENRWTFEELFSVPLDAPAGASSNGSPSTEMATAPGMKMTYAQDRIAVSIPTFGVRIWIYKTGTWQPQREIKRSGVTAVRFVHGGNALVGGCRDGALWYCEVPNGTLRAHAFLGKAIVSLDVNPSGSQLLVGQEGAKAVLVTLRANETKGNVERTYTSEKLQRRYAKMQQSETLESSGEPRAFPAVFATRGQAVLYGVLNGCALVWDRKKGTVVYGLKHPEDDVVQAAATFDGRPGMEGWMITGTRRGRLMWWPQPVAAAANDQQEMQRKRQKRGIE